MKACCAVFSFYRCDLSKVTHLKGGGSKAQTSICQPPVVMLFLRWYPEGAAYSAEELSQW